MMCFEIVEERLRTSTLAAGTKTSSVEDQGEGGLSQSKLATGARSVSMEDNLQKHYLDTKGKQTRMFTISLVQASGDLVTQQPNFPFLRT